MKLKPKLLIVPALASVALLAVCAVATWSMHAEKQGLVELHQGAIARQSAALSLDARMSSTHAGVYRAMNWIASLTDAQIKEERSKLKQAGTEMLASAETLKTSSDDAVQAQVSKLAGQLQQYVKSADDAIDLASVDVNTGTAAMNSADAQYGSMRTQLAALVEQTALGAEAAFTRASDIERTGRWLIWGVTLLGLLLTTLVSLALTRGILRPMLDARRFAEGISGGDLASRLPEHLADETGELIQALGDMSGKLGGVMGSIQQAADQIQIASVEIASGNLDLSNRTEMAASNLEQTRANMEQINQTVRSNTDSARQANQLAMSASEVAQRGGDVVDKVVATMNGIADSSGKIADIIGVIDGIAFQTNILALNAAVEAARAGEQGRGFSVVASEVRSLAQRCTEAASQVKQLITSSVTEVDCGNQLVKDAGLTMKEIVTSVRRVTDIIGEISASTEEQSNQIGEINSAVAQLDDMTQQNAALVEQSSAASDSLREQARSLSGLVSSFKLQNRSYGDARQVSTVKSDLPPRPVPAASGPVASQPVAKVKVRVPAGPVRAPVVAQATAASPAPVAPVAPAAPIPRRATGIAAQPVEAPVVAQRRSPSPSVATVDEGEWETF